MPVMASINKVNKNLLAKKYSLNVYSLECLFSEFIGKSWGDCSAIVFS